MDLKNLDQAAAPATPDGKKTAPVAPPIDPDRHSYEPLIHGESAYDRVTSMLMSVVVGATIIVGWLWLVYFTNQAYAQKAPSQVKIIEVTGGGYEDGELGAQEEINIPGAAPGEMAGTSAPEDAGEFEEAAVQQTSSTVLDAFAAPADGDSEGGEVASETVTAGLALPGGNVRSSQVKRGNGRPLGMGGGPGSGGVPRAQRWIFDFAAGQGDDDYAKLLDTLHIELATPAGGKSLSYASNFTSTPQRRTALSRLDKRMYTSWSSVSRRQYDLSLLRKAGIQVDDNAIILQFLPEEVVQRLSRLEYDYKQKQPGLIRRTRFKVVGSGNNYDFQVTLQEYLK